MAPLHNWMGPVVKKWHWQNRRVLSPFLRCQHTRKFLFLKKAVHGRYYVDYDFQRDIWLSQEAFIFAELRGDFDER